MVEHTQSTTHSLKTNISMGIQAKLCLLFSHILCSIIRKAWTIASGETKQTLNADLQKNSTLQLESNQIPKPQ